MLNTKSHPSIETKKTPFNFFFFILIHTNPIFFLQLYKIEKRDLMHNHHKKMELTTKELMGFQLYIADSLDDPRNAPELPTQLIEDTSLEDLKDNNIILKQFIQEVFQITNHETIDQFFLNKNGKKKTF